MQTENKGPNESTVVIVVELDVEEMEEVIAPRIAINHNETLVGDEVELDVEEVEEVIAPRIAINHNETLALDATPMK
jgi:vacuolar-type H+-ATPase subunit B/Vma2